MDVSATNTFNNHFKRVLILGMCMSIFRFACVSTEREVHALFFLANGTLVMHHGNVQVSYDMRAAVKEAVAWLATNGTAIQDLVVLGITDCEGGDNCTEVCREIFPLML